MLARLLASAAVLAAAGTYLLAQVDLHRRHHPGVLPSRYLWPQLVRIWLPGLTLTATLAVLALWLRRRGRG